MQKKHSKKWYIFGSKSHWLYYKEKRWWFNECLFRRIPLCQYTLKLSKIN